MPVWAPSIRSPGAGSYLTLGVALGLTTGFTLNALIQCKASRKQRLIRSPRETHIPKLTAEEIDALPYPPDALPGGRDVETPYGIIKVFEWGPEDGEKVLLLHGISTPCLALGNLGQELVRMGYRVMIFDFFGRGYSDTPTDLPYDIRLYTTQILLALASSNLAWTGNDGFHLVGYSLGGGIVVPFAKDFPHMVRSAVLIAGGGLIRPEHVSWKSRLLYSTGIFPEWALEFLVRRRLVPSQREAMTETQMATQVVDKPAKKHKDSDANGGDGWDDATLLVHRPGHTVSSVMDWQLRQHKGFIPAFMSSIRYAPIYNQQKDWLALGRILAERRTEAHWVDAGKRMPGLKGGSILLVLGATDTVVMKEELIHDATAVLGEDGFEAVVLNSGHELVMTNATEVANTIASFWIRLPGME
ncbi:Alpha/Beta hydrolase protein [Apiosordaria backusii]|uniref:Alpha/Beta hydrolase protein n=1 Tax=Apiosordaria backusii TaxID=314023 RepID=A0AA40EGG8_9PEZI|nr:Alpha/Beta hydrolase protein [Apiosordaria backusii]